MSPPVAPWLVFGWGNASRGDDGLGPLFVQRLRDTLAGNVNIEFLEDYQLQIEHALDLVGRERVLFVDASRNCQAPFEASTLRAASDASVGTHALSPQALLQVFHDLHIAAAPECTLLAIRGDRFDLGEPVSQQALAHLALALEWAGTLLKVKSSHCGPVC
jgi:hydrogenase maturation protease